MIDFLGSMLTLYNWIVSAILILFLFLIGRLYEIRFGKKSYYQLFLVPLVLFVAAAIWDGFLINEPTGNPVLDFVGECWPDLLWLAGGIVLILLGYSLFRKMMVGKQ